MRATHGPAAVLPAIARRTICVVHARKGSHPLRNRAVAARQDELAGESLSIRLLSNEDLFAGVGEKLAQQLDWDALAKLVRWAGGWQSALSARTARPPRTVG
jgi:hypothetical protein